MDMQIVRCNVDGIGLTTASDKLTTVILSCVLHDRTTRPTVGLVVFVTRGSYSITGRECQRVSGGNREGPMAMHVETAGDDWRKADAVEMLGNRSLPGIL